MADLSDAAKGTNEYDSIYWFNFIPKADESVAKQIANERNCLDLHMKWLSYKVAQEVQKQLDTGKLPEDDPEGIRRCSYRATKMHELMNNRNETPWLGLLRNGYPQREFRCKRATFHAEIADWFTGQLKGLPSWPLTSEEKVEEAFTSIGNAIAKAAPFVQQRRWPDKQYFYIILTTFEWSDYDKTYTPRLRSILFEAVDPLGSLMLMKGDWQNQVPRFTMSFKYRDDFFGGRHFLEKSKQAAEQAPDLGLGKVIDIEV